jgi:hypothetical protein
MSRPKLLWGWARRKGREVPRQELQDRVCPRVDAKTCLGSVLLKSTSSHQFLIKAILARFAGPLKCDYTQTPSAEANE